MVQGYNYTRKEYELFKKEIREESTIEEATKRIVEEEAIRFRNFRGWHFKRHNYSEEEFYDWYVRYDISQFQKFMKSYKGDLSDTSVCKAFLESPLSEWFLYHMYIRKHLVEGKSFEWEYNGNFHCLPPQEERGLKPKVLFDRFMKITIDNKGYKNI